MTNCQKRKITPVKAVAMLKKHGVEVTEAKAADMLEIMYLLAKLIVKQNFNANSEPLKEAIS